MHTPLNPTPPEWPPTTPATQRVYHQQAPADPTVEVSLPPLPVPHPHSLSPQPPPFETEAVDDAPPLDPKIVSQAQKHAKFAISA